MLALDLVEQLRGQLVLPLVEPVAREIVERIDVARDEARIVLLLAVVRAPREGREGNRGEGGEEERTGGEALHDDVLSGSIRMWEAARTRGWEGLARQSRRRTECALNASVPEGRTCSAC